MMKLLKRRKKLHETVETYLDGNPWVIGLRRFAANRLAVCALFIFLFVTLSCIFLPYFGRFDYLTLDLTNVKQLPSREHILGTDSLGRDTLSRLLYGGRVTLSITAMATMLAATVGSLIGILSGFFGGRLDFYLMRFMDVLSSVPNILLAIMLEVALEFGKGNFKYGLAIAAVPPFARLMRASVMSIMGSEYIEASRALGANNLRIVLKHVLHNVAAPLIIQILNCAADTLLACTIMGYIQVGIQPPRPEWGAIVYQARDYMRSAPHLALIPCTVIVVMEMSLHFIGGGLRDALDPNQKS